MATATTLSLTASQLRQYEEEGYCLLEELLPPERIAMLLNRLEEYADGTRPASAGLRIEIEPRVLRGELASDKSNRGAVVRAIKGLVPLDDLFTELALEPRIVAAMQALMGPDLKLFRDAVLMKPPQVGSAKGVHQDSPYWPIEPMNLASCWIAFDAATLRNGCMTVIPGSHKRGPLPHVRVTDDYVVDPGHYDPADLVPVEMAAGTGLIFHSVLVHGTAANTSPDPRRAITLSYMASGSRYTGTRAKPEYFRIAGRDVPGGV